MATTSVTIFRTFFGSGDFVTHQGRKRKEENQYLESFCPHLPQDEEKPVIMMITSTSTARINQKYNFSTLNFVLLSFANMTIAENIFC